jgi:hypothetical protein
MRANSRTWYIKASTIASQAEIASTLVRLMIMINDLSLANNAVIEWSTATEKKRLRRRGGGMLYHVRILMGHVYEALKMIKIISNDSRLRDAVMSCDWRIIDEFLKIESFTKSPEMNMLECFRNKAAFHYDRNLPIQNLHRVVEKLPDELFAYSMGEDGLDWHFELGDAVMNTMIIRDIFHQDYDRSPERTKKVEEIATRQQEIARAFTDFAGHFIRHYSK